MSTRIAALSDRVLDFMGRLNLDNDQNDEGIFFLRYGSTVVMISLFEEKERTYCRFAATVLMDVKPKLELVVRLLRLNTEVLFGAFLLFEDNTLAFTHTLLGETMDFNEFQHALEYVAKVADDHDEELQALAGGERAEDLLQED